VLMRLGYFFNNLEHLMMKMRNCPLRQLVILA